MFHPVQSHGYTLVELVVVMLLLGLIALACESGLHFGGQVWSRTQTNIGRTDEITVSHFILRSLFVNTLPRLKGDSVNFDGDATEVHFDLLPPDAFQEGGTAHAVLRILKGHHGSDLVIDLQSIANPRITKHARLALGTGGLHISYLDASSHSQTWLSYWRNRNHLPDAVRIEGENVKAFPTLIVRLPIVESASCRPEPVSMACRKI